MIKKAVNYLRKIVCRLLIKSSFEKDMIALGITIRLWAVALFGLQQNRPGH